MNEPAARVSLRPFILMCIASAAVSLSNAGNALLVPLYMSDAGLSESYIGLVIGMLALSLVAGRFASGWAIDHWGARGFLVYGALLWAITAPLPVFTTHPALLIAIRIVQGLALAFFTNAGIGYVAYTFGDEVRARMLGYWWLSWTSVVAIGPILAGAIKNEWGYTTAFVIMGAFGLAAVAPSLLVPPIQRDETRERPRVTLLPKSALAPGAVGLSVGFASGALSTYLPLHGHAIGMANPGLYLSMMGFGMVPGQLLFSRLADRRGRGIAIIPGVAIALVSAALLGYVSSLSWSLAFAFLSGFSVSGLSPVLTAWTVDRAETTERTSAASTSVASREMGSFVGATSMGALLGAVGARGAFVAIIVVLAGGLFQAIVSLRSRPTIA